ncbi:MAG: glycosyltransferase family 39 protein, partial [Victivallaceae bacterium]
MDKLLQRIDGLKKFVVQSEKISHWKYCLAIVLIGATLFSSVISATNVLSDEEFTALGNMIKMAATGDYVTPRCGETVFMLNATLHTIAGAWCVKLLGNTIFAAALPAVISAILFMVLIYFMACRMNLRRLTAFGAAMILGFNTTFFTAAQQVTAQLTGCLLLTLAWWSFSEAILVLERGRKLVWYLLFILSGTLLLLTINLSAGALLGLPLLIWLALLDWAEDCFRWRRFFALLLGGGLMLTGYIAYLVWLYQLGDYYTAYSVLWSNNVFSVVGSRSNPAGIGFWYDYLLVAWRFFMPFLPLFLVVLIFDFKLYRQGKSPRLLWC